MKKNNPICHECNSGTLAAQPVSLTGERHGEKFTVTTPGLACDHCGYQTIANSQSGDFTRAVSDAYRAEHGLLTGDEIRNLRNRLGMNQVQFADYLGVGSSSVKRWESGQIQEKAMDELVRLKTDSERARNNYESLENRLSDLHASATTIVFHSDELDLSTCSDQVYYRASRSMGLDMSQLDLDDQLMNDRDLVAA